VLKNPRFGHVLDMMVAEQYRRRGVATRLYDETVKWFKKRGLERVELQVATSNQESQAFWHQMGFSDYLKKVTKNI
jgi:ribosomal protein S18 acetylase RimI-like enzyme